MNEKFKQVIKNFKIDHIEMNLHQSTDLGIIPSACFLSENKGEISCVLLAWQLGIWL
jgi:hypothetical protein